MARLRVFISSTYYDLKHLRSSLELTIEGMGHEAVLSERGDVTFDPESALDESCYAELGSADIVVLIIGGRYGSEISETEKTRDKGEIEDRLREYDSITKKEHHTAIKAGIPVYTFIEKAVFAEYRTYLRNKGSKGVNYAHVDSPNVFAFIEEILALGSNNVVQAFEKAAEIERWLKEQWSGLFRELLRKRTRTEEVQTLGTQVERLGEVSRTLQIYLEDLLRTANPGGAADIIDKEQERRRAATRNKLGRSPVIEFLKNECHVGDPSLVVDVISTSTTLEQCKSKLIALGMSPEMWAAVEVKSFFIEDLNEVRLSLELEPLKVVQRRPRRKRILEKETE